MYNLKIIKLKLKIKDKIMYNKFKKLNNKIKGEKK